MATLVTSMASGMVIRHDPALDLDEQPARRSYLVPDAYAWCSDVLPGLLRDRGRNGTPYEQVEQVLCEVAVGRPMAYDVHCRKLDPE